MTTAQKPLRRKPKQARSLNRVEDILGAALTLIGERGLAALTMREIAAAGDMPLASIYQYFPNKSAVIATLYKGFAERTRGELSEALVGLQSVDDILPAACSVIDSYHERLSSQPALLDVLSAIQADKALQHMDIEETRTQAAQFIEATDAFVDEQLRHAYSRAVHLLFQLAGSTFRIAMMVEEEEGAQIIEDYKNLVRAQLAPFGG